MADPVANPNAAPSGGTPDPLPAHVIRLQGAFARALTEDDIQAIARKLTEQARAGNATSARLVLKYGLEVSVGAAKVSAKANADAAFRADVARVVRAADALEAEERRWLEANSGPRPGGPPPSGQPRR